MSTNRGIPMIEKMFLLLILLLNSNVIIAGSGITHDLQILKKSYKSPNVEQKIFNRQELCLAKNIYYEARGNSINEKFLVGIVTINRTKNKRFFANNICEVIAKKNQFSWYRKFKRAKIREASAWKDSLNISKVLMRKQKQLTSKITFFHRKHTRKTKLAYTVGHVYY